MDLVQINKIKADVIFADKESLESLLGGIEKSVKSIVNDPETAQGRKDITSLAYKVSTSKTALENLGKDHVADLKAKTKIIDSHRKEIKTRLDTLRDEVKAPLVEFENREKERVFEIQEKIDRLGSLSMQSKGLITNPVELSLIIKEIEIFIVDDSFEEFKDNTIIARERILGEIIILRDAAIVHEKEQEELAQLRIEKEARAKADHEEAIRRQAEAEAHAEAFAQAEAEAQRVAGEKANLEAQKIKAEQDKKNAEIKAKQLQERMELAAQETLIAQEKANELAKENEIKRIANEKRVAEEAVIAQEEAVNQERLRVEAEARRKLERAQEEATRREANIEHQKKIKLAILAAILKHTPLSSDDAREVIIAISQGKIPNVKISY